MTELRNTDVVSMAPSGYTMNTQGYRVPRRAKGAYITMYYDDETSFCLKFKLFMKDFPYSLFSVRRKRPGEKEHPLKCK
jgi:hypothetical protein